MSGVHARIQKKAGNLLVTDLDSTNGTFIDDKRLRPGVAATASPGSSITFGNFYKLLIYHNFHHSTQKLLQNNWFRHVKLIGLQYGKKNGYKCWFLIFFSYILLNCFFLFT